MFRNVITVVAAAALAASLTAQQNAGNLHKVDTPIEGVYSFDTGFQLSNPATPRQPGPNTLYDSTDGVVYYYSIPTTGETWIDDPAYEFNAASVTGEEQFDGMTMWYCSSEPDPNASFAVVPVDLEFYNDYLVGGLPTTFPTPECGYTATLPGVDPNTGAFACWQVTFNLVGGLECALPTESSAGSMESFGWGFRYNDPSNSSGPFLDSIFGATGGSNPTPSYGNEDLFEIADANGNHVGTFWFGGGAKAQGAFELVLDGNATDTLGYGPAAPLAGDDWQLDLDNSLKPGNSITWTVVDSLGGAASGFLLISNSAADVATGSATRLVGTPVLDFFPINGSFGPINVPPQAGNFASIFTQVVNGTPSSLTNASNGLESVQ